MIRPLHTASDKKRGFTLIEMLVVLAIISVMTGVILFNYRDYDTSSTLQSTVHDADLLVRQAQVYATAVREYNNNGDNNFDTSYGVHFSTQSGSNTGYVLYANPPISTDSDGVFQYCFLYCPIGGCSGCVKTPPIETHSLRPGYTISKICGGNDVNSCSTSLKDLVVAYTKTDLTAHVIGIPSVGGNSNAYPYAEVTFKAPDQSTRVIVVQATGSSYIK